MTLHYHHTTLHHNTLHHITLHDITLPPHYITPQYTTLHHITLHHITLHYNTLLYLTLDYITSHYTRSHYIKLPLGVDKRLNPQPSTLNPQPSTLNPQPFPLGGDKGVKGVYITHVGQMKSELLALARYQNQWHVMFCTLQKARGKLQCAAFISPRRHCITLH